jgi:hypothetical protein
MADTQQTPLEQRNQCTLEQHCRDLGGNSIDIFDFTKKDGTKTCFVMVAGKVHWASPRALGKIKEGLTASKDGDFDKAKACFHMIQYVESKKSGDPEETNGRSNWVPSLLMQGNAPQMSGQLIF